MVMIFKVGEFRPAYDYFRFPGQHEDERIFYACRAAKIILVWRLILATVVFSILGGVMMGIIRGIGEIREIREIRAIGGIGVIGIIGAYALSLYWIWETWKKTVFIVTNKRLTQFVFTTPWTNYQLSLSLDKVVDTAATTNSYVQRILGVGNLFARSAAGAEGDFLVQNILYTRDLHNWLTKLIYEWEAASKKGEALREFKMFTPKRPY